MADNDKDEDDAREGSSTRDRGIHVGVVIKRMSHEWHATSRLFVSPPRGTSVQRFSIKMEQGFVVSPAARVTNHRGYDASRRFTAQGSPVREFITPLSRVRSSISVLLTDGEGATSARKKKAGRSGTDSVSNNQTIVFQIIYKYNLIYMNIYNYNYKYSII